MNIDKDIKKVREFVNYIRDDEKARWRDEQWFISTENVLSELEKKNTRIKNLEEENELQHCDLQNSYSINNGLKKELEKYKKAYELETYERQKFIEELENWKKIAEKLAGDLEMFITSMINNEEIALNKDRIFLALNTNQSIKSLIIEEARKEVDKDDN